VADCRDAFFNADGRLGDRNKRHAIAGATRSFMNDEASNETTGTEEGKELLDRRLFLKSIRKWSGAAIAAVVFGRALLASPPEANAGAWVNRRGGGGGGG
jgi:hypothetical protein